MTTDDHTAALARARESTRHYPRHEPSAWLRQTAEAAVLRVAAAGGPWREGLSLIVPLVPVWPPPSPDRPPPARLCARCGDTSPTPVRGRYRTCGLAATSGRVPGVVLKFAFELCDGCAVREYGPTAAEPPREGGLT